MTACRVERLTKRFDGQAIVADVSLDVPEGGAVALVGPSGSGKSTLLRLIAGLETPDAGDVWIGGQQVATGGRILVPPYRRGVGLVFQDLALWPHMTAAEHLEFVLAAQDVSRADRAAAITQMLRLVRIEPLARRYPHQLSGGEQQRLALARALIGRPRLLLLDEPLSSIDTDLREALQQELVQLRRRVGVPLLAVTHDRREAAVIADTVIEMRHGRILDSEPGL